MMSMLQDMTSHMEIQRSLPLTWVNVMFIWLVLKKQSSIWMIDGLIMIREEITPDLSDGQIIL